MNAKTGKYSGDRLFHAIYRENDPTRVNFMYLPHNKVETTKICNGVPCVLFEELLVNPNNLITRSGIEISTMGIWDKEKRTFTNPNELHNGE